MTGEAFIATALIGWVFGLVAGVGIGVMWALRPPRRRPGPPPPAAARHPSRPRPAPAPRLDPIEQAEWWRLEQQLRDDR